MTYKEFKGIDEINLFPLIQEAYGLEGYSIKPIDRGYEFCEGQNAVYSCEKEGENTKIMRISLNDRSDVELLAEVEYVRYLYENGGYVSNVLNSRNGNLMEVIAYKKLTFSVCLFEKAKGKQFSEYGYRYREGVPIAEYHYNIGRTIGKIHQLSKGYESVHHRYSFSDKCNPEYINELIPDSFSLLKSKLYELLSDLSDLGFDRNIYGMIHYDYNDSNYSIDYETGQITVYDFDNSCFGWYMYDLAFTWMFGVGVAHGESDPIKRKIKMETFLNTVIKGYRSETVLNDGLLSKFPIFINVVVLDHIIEAFKYIRSNGEEPEYDFELSYLIKCIEDDIPYVGFFLDMFSWEAPFEYEDERIDLFITTLKG